MRPASNGVAPSLDWLTELPKVELHVHLEGSMSPATIAGLADRHDVDTTAVWPGGIPERFSFGSFPEFARQFLFGIALLRTGDDITTAIEDLAGNLARGNVRYAEVTTTPYSHVTGVGRPLPMPADEYRAALDAGRRSAAAMGVVINWVLDIPRDLEAADSWRTIEVIEQHPPDGLVALGLGGDESLAPAEAFEHQFARARALGLGSVPHAGETVGPESVVAAIDRLGATRIGHGVRAADDDRLLDRIREAGILLEVCPTSNVLLGVAPDHQRHQIGALLDAGVAVCVNTDDPGWFATDIVTELAIVSEHHAVDAAGHVAMQRVAIGASFADEALRRSILDELASHARPSPGAVARSE